MAFSKKIKLYMRSSIWELDGNGERLGTAEISETEYDAALSFGPMGALVTYTENTEGGKINAELTLSETSVTVKKSGAISSYMVFRIGEEFKSLYSIPPYSFDMLIGVINEEKGLSSIVVDPLLYVRA